jgi:lipid-binding SYLF domain-containing protein
MKMKNQISPVPDLCCGHFSFCPVQTLKSRRITMKTKATSVLLLAVLMSTLTGCAAPKGKTVLAKRASAQNMVGEALYQLYRLDPTARREVTTAPGYAVFEAIQTQILISSTGNAYGIVRNNLTGGETHMKAFSAGAGFGAGIKNFRAIVVFKDPAIMEEFVNKGWVFGAHGTADAMYKGGGGTASGVTTFDGRMKVYTFTESGLMAGVSLRGVKVWKNKELN